jgi:hypothetical protein
MNATDLIALRCYVVERQAVTWADYLRDETGERSDLHDLWYRRRGELEAQLELLLKEVTGI